MKRLTYTEFLSTIQSLPSQPAPFQRDCFVMIHQEPVYTLDPTAPALGPLRFSWNSQKSQWQLREEIIVTP